MVQIWTWCKSTRGTGTRLGCISVVPSYSASDTSVCVCSLGLWCREKRCTVDLGAEEHRAQGEWGTQRELTGRGCRSGRGDRLPRTPTNVIPLAAPCWWSPEPTA